MRNHDVCAREAGAASRLPFAPDKDLRSEDAMRPVLFRRLAAPALLLLLAGCAAQPAARISSAATSPMADFNVGQADIPALLLQIQKQPYLKPVDQSCAATADDVKALDELLGADVDAPVVQSDASDVERGATFLGDTAVGAFKGAVEGLVPYRSWVRKLSGAERHSKALAATIAAGNARRAFLKGLRMAQGCP